jgi:hypothetical protein
MSEISRLKDLAISESGFVFDPMLGATFTVNASGVCIIHALREGCSRTEILSRLRDKFTVQTGDLDGDLGDFIRLLIHQGILPQEFTLDAPKASRSGR